MARVASANNPPASNEPTANGLRLRCAMRSDPGRIRSENQDACAAAPELGIFLICDGMGGAAAGELASQLAAEAFLHSIGDSAGAAQKARLQGASNPPGLSVNPAQVRLEQAIGAANLAVFQRAQKYRALRGMGTTLVAALFETAETGRCAWVAHVGDSRCYLHRKGRLQQLTADHSLVEEQIEAGLLSRQQAEFSPVRNVITRAVGTQPTVLADIAEHKLDPGDLLLLASDGLTRELSDDHIAQILPTNATNLDRACEALIRAANASGGRDNITVLLIACD
jgi:PPM family protein phosphatase